MPPVPACTAFDEDTPVVYRCCVALEVLLVLELWSVPVVVSAQCTVVACCHHGSLRLLDYRAIQWGCSVTVVIVKFTEWHACWLQLSSWA